MNHIKSYKDLKDAVKLWLNRRDAATLDNIPMFIRFAEKQFTRLIQIPYYESLYSVTASEEYRTFKIPQDLLKFKHVTVNGVPYNRSDVETFMRLKNTAKPADEQSGMVSSAAGWREVSNRFGSTTTREFFFTRIGDSLHFLPTPKVGDEIQVIYYQDIPEMVNDNDQPYSLLTSPDLMLYLSLRHASIFLRDNEQEQYWMAKSQEAADSINKQLDDAEWSGSSLVVPYFGE